MRFTKKWWWWVMIITLALGICSDISSLRNSSADVNYAEKNLRKIEREYKE